MDEYLSLYRGGSGEIEEKKSRFIASIEPVKNEEEAAAFISKIKKQYWDARHNCTAFICGDNGQIMRSSDDGEPSGTAGRPMLEILTSHKITNICVVVTRYFGGTLLGTGGLIRAYQGAVKAGLENCVILQKLKGITLIAECDYTDYGKLSYMAMAEKWDILSTDFSGNVIMKLLIEDKCINMVKEKITDATSGRVKLTEDKTVIFAHIGDEIEIFDE